MKFTKFEVTKMAISDVVTEYKDAKEENNELAMEQLENEFDCLKKVLWSSYNYAKNDIDAAELYSETQDETIDEHKKEQNEILLGQRTLYLKNKQYVNNVEMSENIEDFMKKDNRKGLNFVKRHFGKFALGAAAAATVLALSLSGCSKNNKETKEETVSITKESSVENNKSTETTESDIKVTENSNITDVTKEERVKLNPLPEYHDNNEYITDTDGKQTGNNANVDKNTNSNGVKFTYNNEAFKKQETTEALDPHVNNNDAGKKTTVTVKKETTVTEKEPVDYKNKVTDNTKVNDKEKVTVTTKEEKKEVNTTNIPIDGAKEEKAVDYKPTTKDDDFIPTEEQVTIIEVEETKEVNTNITVEEEKVVYEDTEEKVTYVEEEEKEEINTEDLPIEGLAKPKTLVYRM